MTTLPKEVELGQASASDPANSAFVAANAGSGKTYVLASRVIRLLFAGVDPQRILCLTYTRAAAAEMKSRVFATLGEWALMEKGALATAIRKLTGEKPDAAALSRARQLFARALETPGGLKVETIHAFCERVLHRFPLEAGLAPGFTLIDETAQAELFREALTASLAEPEIGRAVEDVSVQLSEDGLADLLAELSGRDPHRRTLLIGQEDAVRKKSVLAALNLAGVPQAADQIAAFLAANGPRDAERRTIARRLLAGGKTLAKAGEGMLAMLGSARDAAAFEAYCLALLTTKNEPRKLKMDDAEVAEFIAAEQSELVRLIGLDRRWRIADFSLAMGRIARAVLQRYDGLKRARQLLDFQDLVLHMRALLTERSEAQWVLYKLDGGLDHILIDEAQDTSPEQWDIVHKLAEEFFAGEGRPLSPKAPVARTIFAVGDEKQSIYSFQGADPEAFGHSGAQLGARVSDAGRNFENVRLRWSFRSSPAILKAVDAVFGGGAAASGLSHNGSDVSHAAVKGGLPGTVELWDLTEPPQNESEEPDWDAPLDALAEGSAEIKLARRIGEHVHGLIHGGTCVAETGKRITAGDVMILVQRRNNFVDALIRDLKRRGLAVAGADRLKLATHMAVQDLMALGAFVVQPDDDLALAGLLKSPLVGVSEDELFDLAHNRQGKRLRAVIRARAAAGDARAILWQARLDEFRSAGTRLSPFDFYARVLGPMGGRNAFLSRMGIEAHDPLDAFLEEAAAHEDVHAPSLQGFLAAFARGEGEIKRDLDARGDAIRIMTVHGAKGLEAPIVILPDTTREPAHGSHDPMFFVVDDAVLFRTSSARCDVLDDAIDRSRRARREESHRALYVAMTRAKEHLVICGAGRTREIPAESWYALVAPIFKRDATEDATRNYRVWRHVHQGKTGAAAAGADRAAPSLAPLPAWARMKRVTERAREIIAPSRVLEAAEGAGPAPAGNAADALKRGRIIHKLLEHLPGLAPESRAAAATKYLALPMHALSAAMQDEFSRATLDLLVQPELAPLFADGLAEAPIAGEIMLAGRPMQVGGTIDRLLVSPARVIVLDYKTNRIAPDDAGGVTQAYVVQMALYRELVRVLYPGRAVECALLYTAAPRAIFLDDAAMDAALSRAFPVAGPLP